MSVELPGLGEVTAYYTVHTASKWSSYHLNHSTLYTRFVSVTPYACT